jgi:hypothetical protein
MRGIAEVRREASASNFPPVLAYQLLTTWITIQIEKTTANTAVPNAAKSAMKDISTLPNESVLVDVYNGKSRFMF